MPNDAIILSEFRKAIKNGGTGDVLNLDDRLNHKFDIAVERFEDVLLGTNRSIPPNRWSYYRIGLITAGTGEFTTGIYKFKARKNTLVVMPTRIITSSRNWTLDMQGYLTVFNTEFFLQNNFSQQLIDNKRILSGSSQPYVHLTDEGAATILEIFESLYNERKNGNQGELMALKVLELLANSERLFDEELHFDTNEPVIDIMRRFSDLVEANFATERTVSFYAEQLHLHPNYLNALVKKHTGLTAKESIQSRLVLEVKYMLHSTTLTIKEIADKVGFNDANYFSSFFTRLENTSPTAYRASFV